MSGSRRAFTYTCDNGDLFTVRLDESTYETAELGFAATALDTANPSKLITQESGFAARYVLGSYLDADDRPVTRKFWVGTLAAFITLQSNGDVTIDGQLYILSKFVGESITKIGIIDTGIIDGDTPN